MGVKVAATCFQWSQPIIPHSPSSSQTLASTISSPSSTRRIRGDGGSLLCRCVHRLERSTLFGTSLTRLHRSRSFQYSKLRTGTMKRSCSASLDGFSDEEFSKEIQELALRFQLSADGDEADDTSTARDSGGLSTSGNHNSVINFEKERSSFPSALLGFAETPWLEIGQEPDWPERDEAIPASIERKANSVDLPLSLRIIKRKMQWQEGIREAGESAYCSVKKAFSTMVFMIHELHSYSLQLREILFFEDLQGILGRVQKEIQASFVWLFQQVFSHTPTLMVYVMILLANFTVYSVGHNAAMAAAPPPASHAVAGEIASVVEIHEQKHHKFDTSATRTFSVSSSSGKTASIDGINGGGGKTRPVAGGIDGDGRFNGAEHYRSILPDGASQLSSVGTTREAESVSGEASREDEVALWNSMVEEASRMQAVYLDEALDHEMMKNLVSPVTVKIETDDDAEYSRTELLYQSGLLREPNNPLLLANYAQFLYLVAHDYDRAEEYFKRATAVEPPDAEAYDKYATFLWRVRKDVWAAEETFLEAISADPSNSFYAANYAHFLWNTGGEDTCFPLASPDTTLDA